MAIPQDRYYDLDSTSAWLKRLLYLSIFMSVVGAVSTIMELRLFAAAEQGLFASDEELVAAAEVNDWREMIVSIAGFIVVIATSVQALIWIYRSAHNARVRATHMEYTPASCVWWYFIPIAHFWKPYGAMRAIWREFASQAGKDPDTGRGLSMAWWAFWVISGLMNQVSVRLMLRAEDMDRMRISDRFELFVLPFDLISMALFISLVIELTRLQGEADASRRLAAPPAPAPQIPET